MRRPGRGTSDSVYRDRDIARTGHARRRGPSLGDDAPTVSVIVPSYNYGHLLEGCVASILAQEGVRVQVQIIDDCSPDDTSAIGRRLAMLDERVEFHRQDTNAGLIATANAGLRRADGDYVLLLSADDLLVPDCLHRATTVMSAHPSVGMVYGRARYAHEGRPIPAPTGRWRGADIWTGADWIGRRCRSGYNCVSSPTAVVRNSVQRSVGDYDQDCTHASDLNMWLRIAAITDIAYIRGIPQAIYRVHSASMMRSHDGPLVDLRERRLGFDSFFMHRLGELAEMEELRALSARALAGQALWLASRAIDRGGPHDPIVEDLIGFALDTYPDCEHLREWRGIRSRMQRSVPKLSAHLPSRITRLLRGYRAQLRLRVKGV
jgi:glycosyltransferase involved in cell wall biosynthesis